MNHFLLSVTFVQKILDNFNFISIFIFWIKEMHSFPLLWVLQTLMSVSIVLTLDWLSMYQVALFNREYHYLNTDLFWVTRNMFT